LLWLGAADRTAGDFDDIVLGLSDRVAAYQVKTTRDPRPFSIRTILLGARKVLRRMIEARERLKADHPNTLIETIYVCDDHPRTDDHISNKSDISSAAFLRAHAEQRLFWNLRDWKTSPFGDLVEAIHQASQLSDTDFEAAWQNMRFLAAGQGRALGLGAQTTFDDHRLREIAAMLPRLVADLADHDRWNVSELLRRLHWRNIFRLRHSHAFPLDALYETNVPTQNRLHEILSNVNTGYVSLVGPPGCGKSTLLSDGASPNAESQRRPLPCLRAWGGSWIGACRSFRFFA
jgi:hypothetical protein